MTTEVTRRDPFWGVETIQDEMQRMMRQMFGDGGEREPTQAGTWAPALDVEEGEDAFTVHVELPGVAPEDVAITLEDDVLVIHGERRFYDEGDSDDFRRVERRYGRFYRALRLPARVDPDAVEARSRDGLLEITVPKSEEARPRRIPIQSG